MKKRATFAALVLVLLSLMTVMVMAKAPVYTVPAGSASVPVVDGAYGEWNMTTDFFANMYEAGNPDKTLLAKLYLRYNCDQYALYFLILAEPGFKMDISDLEDYWIDFGSPLKKYQYPTWSSKAWVMSGSNVVGVEASILLTPGSYTTEWHGMIYEEGTTGRTASTGDIALDIDCGANTAIELASFAARTAAGGVCLDWATGTELDNNGFNLYRAADEGGPYVQINDALIPADGDAFAGAAYSYTDAPGYGTFYYKLEDVDLSGLATLHGPVSVTVAPPFRLPVRRPAIPR